MSQFPAIIDNQVIDNNDVWGIDQRSLMTRALITRSLITRKLMSRSLITRSRSKFLGSGRVALSCIDIIVYFFFDTLALC